MDPTIFLIEYGTSFIFDFFLGYELSDSESENINGILEYYLVNCIGPSPAFNNTIAEDVTFVQTTVALLVSSDSPCENNQKLVGSLVILDDLLHQLDVIRATVACPPLQYYWSQAIEDGLCTDIVSGLFLFLLVLFGLSLLLFLLSIAAYLMSFHFGEMWIIKKGYIPTIDEDEEGEIENEHGGNVEYEEVPAGNGMEMVIVGEVPSADFGGGVETTETDTAAPVFSTSSPATTPAFVEVPLPAPFNKKRYCEVCRTIFVAGKNPRHHCRNCGKSVCSAHGCMTAACPAFPGETAKRVCDNCYGILNTK